MHTFLTRSLAASILGAVTVLSLLGCSNQSTQAANSSDTSRPIAALPNPLTVATTASSPVQPPSEVTDAQPTTSSSPSVQVATYSNSEPKTVVDEFFQAYVLQKTPWQQLQEYFDPDTYQQLSQLKGYDSDPFIAAQEPAFDYLVGESRISGNTAEVDIQFKIGFREPLPTEFGRSKTVVLQNNEGRWQIKNVIYSAEPDPSGLPNDLLHGWMDTQKNFYPNLQ